MTVSTPSWVRDAVFYQIFPDRFARRETGSAITWEDWNAPPTSRGFKGGNLGGVVDHLDYLSDLGITAIYFTPIFASAANHRYHTYDYYNVDPILGGNDALRELLDAAHGRQMRVVLDGVFNHASRGIWQFHHVLENGNASPYVDWFHFEPSRLDGRQHFAAYPDPDAQDALAQGAGSYEAIGYQAWWNLPALPKFNTKTKAVREFLWDIGTHWIEFGIDGWRLDVPQEIDDDEFWREFRRRVKGANADAYIVGEIWHKAERWLQGDQFDAVMNYPVTTACMGFFGRDHLNLKEARRPSSFRYVSRIDASEFAEQIVDCLGWYDPSIAAAQLNLLDSHDTPRFLTSVSDDVRSLQLSFLFLCTIPGAPCLFYGDEIGLTGRHDPDCRRGFPWDESLWRNDVRQSLQRCLHLRHSNAALRHGEFVCQYSAVTDNASSADVYAFSRIHDSSHLFVAFNAGGDEHSVNLPEELATGSLEQIDVLDDSRERLGPDTVSIVLPPRSARVVIRVD